MSLLIQHTHEDVVRIFSEECDLTVRNGSAFRYIASAQIKEWAKNKTSKLRTWQFCWLSNRSARIRAVAIRFSSIEVLFQKMIG